MGTAWVGTDEKHSLPFPETQRHAQPGSGTRAKNKMGRRQLRKWRLQWIAVVTIVGLLFVLSYWSFQSQHDDFTSVNEKIFLSAQPGKGAARFGFGRSGAKASPALGVHFDTGFRSFVEPDDAQLRRYAGRVPSVDGQPLLPAEGDVANMLASGAPAAAVLSSDTATDVYYRPRYRLVAVAKVGNEMPYILEWIDFHIHQGFDHFVLYIDDSPFDIGSDYLETLRLLPEYYAQLGHPGDLIEVKTIGGSLGMDATADIADGVLRSKTSFHRLTQQTLVKHAFERYKYETEWMMHFDVDEFVHPISLPHANVSLNYEAHIQKYPQDEELSEWQIKLRTVEREGDNFNANAYGDGRGKLTGADWTLARYLQNLYTDAHSPVAESYRMGYMTGIYVTSAPFGIGDAYWFSPMVKLVRNEANGKLELFYSPSVPAGDLGDNSTAPGDPVRDGKRMAAFMSYLSSLELLDGAAAKDFDPLISFYEAFKNTTFDHPQWQDYPFQILRQSHKTFSVHHGDSIMSVAEHHHRVWSECAPVLEALKSHLEEWKSFLRDEIRVKDTLRNISEEAKGWPNYCFPAELPYGMTTMGKSLLWTGLRYDPPKGFDLDADMARHARQAYVLPQEVVSSTWGGRPRESPDLGVMWDQPSPSNWPRRRGLYDPRLTVPGPGMPYACAVPWVHSCGHSTKHPVFISRELRLDHHMLRSMEARTIGDAKWRAGRGWGKFFIREHLKFSVIRFTHAKYEPSVARTYGTKLAKDFLARHQPIRRPLVINFDVEGTEEGNGGTPLNITVKDWYKDMQIGKCEWEDLSTLRRNICPESHPYVGTISRGRLRPYTYCHNESPDGSIKPENIPDQENAGNDEAQRLWSMNHLRWDDFADWTLCGSFPRTVCCDYDPELFHMLQAKSRANLKLKYLFEEHQNNWRG